jgi:muramidase (phage lysozyme)
MIEETGIGIKNPLWFVGVIENRNDPRKEGRVQVRAFGIHGTNAQIPTERLPWAICISGNYDPNYPIPPLNSWVFGFFLDGRDAQQPMILGLIPTQMTALIDPETNGWGVIPTENVNLHSQGSRAVDYGQPQNSRKARGEDLDKTDVLLQEVNRVKADFTSLEENFILEEPAPGNQSVYPFNRITETAGGHSIELDDTPGAERIRVGHSSGSYIEMHQNGIVVLKSLSDLWFVGEGNINVISKGRNIVKVEGDAIISVDGNMIQEVNGDMRQIVRGNYELSVAGQLNLNGSEEIQARAGKIRIESNVEGINLKAAKKINIQSGENINIKSGKGISQEANEDINIKADNLFIQGEGAYHLKIGDNIFQESSGNINIKGSNLFIEGSGNSNIKSAQIFLDSTGNMNIKAAYTKIGNGVISLNGTSVAIDDIVFLASGEAVVAPGGTPAESAEPAIAASPAENSDLPPPANKSSGNGSGSNRKLSGGGYKNAASGGSGGYISQDDSINTDSNSPASSSTSFTRNALTPLLDLIGAAEGAGYNTIFGGIRREDYPPKSITSMTIGEVLAWQSSIDQKYNSEAVGRYQIMEDTLRGFNNDNRSSSGPGLYARAGLTLNDLFSPQNQDLMAIELLKQRGLNRFFSGSLTDVQFGDNLSYEWASLPIISGPRAGQGRYTGQGGKIKIQTVLDALKKVKNYNATETQ